MSNRLVKKVSDELENLRAHEEMSCRKRVSQIHTSHPELEEIRKEIADAGRKLAIGVATNPSDEDKLKKECDLKIKELSKRRDKILKDNGIDTDYDKVKYTCELCKDTGYINNERCRCFKSLLVKYSFDFSNLSEYMKSCTFDKINFNYFSKDAGGDGISPYDRAKTAVDECRKISEHFDEYGKNILILGGPGVGKTYLTSCVANELLGRGYSVLYIGSNKLFGCLEAKKFGKELSEFDADIITNAYTCDLLIIDDLGTELPSKFNASFLYDILNERYLGGKKLIINTNLSVSELEYQYTERFTSRLFESFFILRLSGEDIRKQKMYE